MISKSTIKLIKSLSVKKYREKEKLFLIEGDKNVLDALNSGYPVKQLFVTEQFVHEHKSTFSIGRNFTLLTKEELKKASLLQNPQNCLAICELPSENQLPSEITDISLYLDGIRDPGNLGTIIRTCDWFGIKQLFCSPDTVDMFNPKVIQASMGSFCRIQLTSTEIEPLAKLTQHTGVPVFGSFMDGKNMYTENLPSKAIIVIGNEGQGIRQETEKSITNRISIPAFSQNSNTAESLNAAIAASIICSEFKRQSLYSK